MMSFPNNYSFIFFPFVCLIFSFSCIIMSVAKTSRSLLDKSGKNGYFYLVSDVREKSFHLLPFNMRLTVGCRRSL